MTGNTTLYEDVVNITYDYLGPATDRFVTRQIKNHLHKRPEELRKKDLKELIEWISAAVNLLSDDNKLVSKYVSDLRRLVKSPR
jgi:uncharacterized protein YegL